jgi:predicted phage terminase large subunit-like protein
MDFDRKVRRWDLAATEPHDGNKDPDWTAGVKMGRSREGNVYITDCQHYRGSPSTNEKRIAATAQIDGTGVRIRMEQEPGASGKSMIDHYQRSVIFGFDFQGKPSLKKKILRWNPLSAMCEQGRVFLVKGAWNQDFIDELEGCKGEDEKNDQADAASGALEELAVGTGAFGSSSDLGGGGGAGSSDPTGDTPIDFQQIGGGFFN